MSEPLRHELALTRPGLAIAVVFGLAVGLTPVARADDDPPADFGAFKDLFLNKVGNIHVCFEAADQKVVKCRDQGVVAGNSRVTDLLS